MRSTSAAELLGEEDDGASPPRRGRAGWLFVAALVLIALAMVAYTLVEGDRRPLTSDERLREPSSLTVRVSGAVVTLEGRVPDLAARDRLVELARSRYGPTNVIDTLVIDEGTVLEGGSVTVAGSAAQGDETPGGLQSDLVSSLGLRAGPVLLTEAPPPVTGTDESEQPGSDP